MQIKKIPEKIVLIKLFSIFCLSLILPCLNDLSQVSILKSDFMLNFLAVLFSLSLAVLAIFFTLIEKYKVILGNEKFLESFSPIINEYKEDITCYLIMIVIIVFMDLLPYNLNLRLFNCNLHLYQTVLITILLLAILILYDILSATLKLINFISTLE